MDKFEGWIRFKGNSLPHALWGEFFGPYPWFFLPLAGEVVARSGLQVSKLYAQFKNDALTVIDDHNLAFENSWGQWGSLSLVQFKSGLSRELMRLDKAFISGMLVSFLAEDGGNKFVEATTIIPSTFVIEGIERKVISDQSFLEHLLERTRQRRLLFEEIARGAAVVEYIAYDIYEACHEMGFNRVDVRLLKNRSDFYGGRLTRPASAQQLDSAKIRSFYKI